MKSVHIQTAKRQTEALMNEMLPLAERMLIEHGEFYPYGGYITKEGEIVHVAVQRPSEKTASKPMIDTLVTAFRQDAKAHGYHATAIVFDVRIKPPGAAKKTDAIQVCLDHKDDYSAEVFFPYTIGHDGKLEFAPTFAQEGDYSIFGRPR